MNDPKTEMDRLLKDIEEKTGAKIEITPSEKGSFTYRGKRYLATAEGKELSARECALVQYVLANAEPENRQEKSEQLKDILLGEGSPLTIFRFMTRYAVADGVCFAVDVVPDKHVKEAAALILRCVEGMNCFVLPMDGKRIAVVKFMQEEQTPFEFGSFLEQSLYEELGIRAQIGIGCEQKSFVYVAHSYQQAAIAVRYAGEVFRSEGNVHTYREYLLVRMLEELPKSRLEEYFAQFDVENAAEVFEDEELAETAEQLLECNLNASEASRKLYMHRNTLSYRLDKIESATGLNIRKFSDAVTFRVVTVIYKLLHS